MTEIEAKLHLRQMLNSLTPGSVLNLLSELFHASAAQARNQGDEKAHKQAQEVAATLFVVGVGVDAAYPR